MTMYAGMVTLYNKTGIGSDNISFVAFDKENAKKELVKIAGEVLASFIDAYKVENDPIDDESIVLVCQTYPRKIRYWIKEVSCIDEAG